MTIETLAEHYRRTLNLEVTAIPSPIDLEDVVAPERDPIFLTMVNPEPAKGLAVVAHLAEELSLRRPDLPILVVESRGTAGQLVACGLRGGFDLRRHENIMTSGPVPRPRDLFAPARVLLVPSLVEAGARVVAEALLNGVPSLVSDRGGLPEMCNGAGAVFPLPPALSITDLDPVAPNVVEPWIEAILPWMDDDLYAAESQRARDAGGKYRPESLAPQYDEFFARVFTP